jgi:hypothetical protein
MGVSLTPILPLYTGPVAQVFITGHFGAMSLWLHHQVWSDGSHHRIPLNDVHATSMMVGDFGDSVLIFTGHRLRDIRVRAITSAMMVRWARKP